MMHIWTWLKTFLLGLVDLVSGVLSNLHDDSRHCSQSIHTSLDDHGPFGGDHRGMGKVNVFFSENSL